MTLTKAYLGNISLAAAAGWQRPAQWLPIEDVTQGLCGIHRINEDGNFVAFTVSGAFTVDWGDGPLSGGLNTPNVQQFAAGQTASHHYNWGDISSAGETQLGYRHVRIRISPQSGQSITSLNLAVMYPLAGLTTDYSTGWLEIVVNGPNLTSLAIASGSTNVRHRCLESAKFLSFGGVTSLGHLLSNCNRLQKVELASTSAVLSINNMFQSCSSLRAIPWFDTSNVTNANSVFSTCSSLVETPALNLAKATNLGTAFFNCVALRKVGQLTLGAATNTNNMFASCPCLVTVPVMATANVTDAYAMFGGCLNLYEVPAIDLSAASSPSVIINAKNLVRFRAFGMKESFSLANLRLSAAALDEVYTNLANVTGKTISVGGNYGTAGHNPSIATSKGWTVAV